MKCFFSSLNPLFFRVPSWYPKSTVFLANSGANPRLSSARIVSKRAIYFPPLASSINRSISIAFPNLLFVGSIESSPYVNWTTVLAVFLTVPSYLTLRSSRAFIKRRCIYPDLEVRTAVSTNPSLPPMEWKKYSVGVKPFL